MTKKLQDMCTIKVRGVLEKGVSEKRSRQADEVKMRREMQRVTVSAAIQEVEYVAVLVQMNEEGSRQFVDETLTKSKATG